MNNILNVKKEKSTEIEFVLNNGKLVSVKTKGDEEPLLLESLFSEIEVIKLIPEKHLVGEVTMTLTDGDDEGDVRTLDVYFYREGVLDEDETPILELNDQFIKNIKDTLRFSYLNSILDEVFDGLVQHINTNEFKEQVKEDLKMLGVEIDFVDMSPTKKYGEIELLKYDVDFSETIDNITDDIVFI